MSSLEAIPVELIDEGRRMASICNACRYCEGYCAVFPALERRLSFAEGDLAYLANLCHDCGACYYACQYAPPHEFQLNFPKMLAQIRGETYKRYAWPGSLARAFERNGLVVSLITAASLALFLLVMTFAIDPSVLFAPHPDSEGSFYAVIPHNAMAYAFGAIFLFAIFALCIGSTRFWRDTEEEARDFLKPGPFGQSVADALQLSYLGGGGEGCTYPDEKPSDLRRWFHHFTFYGFMLCFAATCVATVYHYVFGWKAPYPLWSLPVLLGTFGGMGLLIGPAGLLWLKRIRDPALSGAKQTGMDVGFLALLLLVSVTGLMLLALRETAAMGVLLAAHLGVVMALFITLPYGKFVHAVYRFAALVRYHLERKRPLPEINAE
ncbi:MAG TPA: tricarballylate utilization 4Fe-4S protein TcuB [Casimicrobiaceae bacterium]|jgi:citrate/tricarballylate utilization protein|nr:tricarballylate utilization 4Fe-4S protein TcuB [Casimicrobiaceae bacterium]